MRLRRRFTLLSFSIAALAGAMAFATVIISEYRVQLTRWQAQVENAIALDENWASELHFRDRQGLQDALAALALELQPAALLDAVHADGTVLSAVGTYALTKPPARSDDNRFDTLAAFQDSGTVTLRDAAQAEQSAHSDWLDQLFVVSVPISSSHNPFDSDISVADYYTQKASSASNGARFLVGYIDAGIESSRLLFTMADVVLPLLGLAVVLLAATLLTLRAMTASITKPVEQMAAVADAISRSDLPKNPQLPVTRDDEIGDIAKVLLGVIDNAHKVQQKAKVDKQLLALQVDSASKRLSEAEQKVSASQAQIRKVAYYDPVTGLPNQRLLQQHLRLLMELAARERKRLGLLLVDLSELRKVDASLGRAQAERALREVCDRASLAVRKSDVLSQGDGPSDIGRLGQDELCLVLHDIRTAADGDAIAHRLASALQRPIALETGDITLNLAMALAVAPEHGKKPETLMRAAGIALADARAGNKPFSKYAPELDAAGSERFQLELDLRKANIEREFELHYQPQIDAKRGHIVGVEALLRWRHPKQGLIPPFKFIPVAEDTGVIVQLGLWVLQQACTDMMHLKQRDSAPPKVSINVSALQLTDEFVTAVEATLTNTGLPAACLELELTESLLVQSVDAVLTKLNRLRRDIGVRLSIDDFGTGYSSLAYLSRFPLNELKVDRSFVLAMSQDDHAQKVVAAIIAMGRELGLDIVVEGVDEAAQVTLLASFGAHIIQGFLFSKPLPIIELEQFLREPPAAVTAFIEGAA